MGRFTGRPTCQVGQYDQPDLGEENRTPLTVSFPFDNGTWRALAIPIALLALGRPASAGNAPDGCDPQPLEFAPAGESVALAGSPVSLASRDVDLDGSMDVIVGSLGAADTTRIQVFQNDGSGGLSFVQEIPSDGLEFVTLAQLDGDALPDLITANGSSVRVHINQGGARFGDAVVLEPTGVSLFAAVGHLNSDDIPDVLSVNPAAGSVSLFIQTVNGSFETAEHFDVGPLPRAVVVADFNDDDTHDLAVTLDDPGIERVAVFPRQNEGETLYLFTFTQ